MASLRELFIQIVTRADSKGAQDTSKALGEVEKKTTAAGTAATKTGQSLDKGLGTGARNAASQIPALGRLAPVLQAGTVAAGALAAGIGVVAVGIASAARAIRDFAGAQEKITDLDAALATSGELTERYRTRLQELSGELQNATGVADDDWQVALKNLVTIGRSSEDQIESHIEAVKNLAGITGQGIPEASILFAKALAGNTSTLSRYGIVLEKTGDQTKDTEALMKLLADRGAGILEARGKTLSGQWRNLSNSTGDLFEAFGNLISKTGALDAVTGLLQGTLNGLNSLFPQIFARVEGLANKFPQLADAEREAREATGELAEGMEDADAAAKALAAQGMEALKKELDAITEKTRAAVSEIEKLQRRQDELADATLALELAKVDAGPGTEVEKLQRKQDLRKQAASDKFDRAQAANAEQQKAIEADSEAQRISAGAQANDVTGPETSAAAVESQMADIRTKLLAHQKRFSFFLQASEDARTDGGYNSKGRSEGLRAKADEATIQANQLKEQHTALAEVRKGIANRLTAERAEAAEAAKVHEEAKKKNDAALADLRAEAEQRAALRAIETQRTGIEDSGAVRSARETEAAAKAKAAADQTGQANGDVVTGAAGAVLGQRAPEGTVRGQSQAELRAALAAAQRDGEISAAEMAELVRIMSEFATAQGGANSALLTQIAAAQAAATKAQATAERALKGNR